MATIVPPGGHVGYANMTPASRAAWFRPGASRGPSRRRKSGTKSKSRRRSSAKRKGTGRKMKFGSPAWQKKYKVGKFNKKRRRK